MNKDIEPIVIIGSGGFAREVLMLIRQLNKYNIENNNTPLYKIIGFIDNDKNKWNTLINNLPVLGDEEWLLNYNKREKKILNAALGVGQPFLKRKIVSNLGENVKWPNLIHPSAIISIDEQDGNKMGVGNIITANNILTCNINIGNYIMLNLACTIGHETVIDDYVVISPGANISGNVHLHEGVYVGTGAKILEKITVGKWSTIGGAALVNKDIDDNSVAVGVPAKVIKQLSNGWHI